MGTMIAVINLIAIIAFIFAFLNAEEKGKIILAVIIAVLFLLPHIYTSVTLFWIYYAAKVIFALSCLLYIKSKRFL